MKNIKLVTLIIAVLCIAASAACAVVPDFEIEGRASTSPAGDWIYKVTNHSASSYVVAFTLYWQNPFFGTNDQTDASANFYDGDYGSDTGNSNYGYQHFTNGNWEPDFTYANHPGFGSVSAINRIAPVTGVVDGFQVFYKGAVKPTFFQVNIQDYQGNPLSYQYGNVSYVGSPSVPEPGSMLALLSGLIGSVGAFRFRRK